MHIESLGNSEEWENFVINSSKGTFYHTLKWKRVLEEAFPLKTEYLVIRDSTGELVGVCPFVISKVAKLFNVLDSLPKSDFGGPLIKEECIEEAATILNRYLKELRGTKGITYAKIRCSDENLYNQLKSVVATVDTSTGTMNLNLKEKRPAFIWNEIFTQKSQQRTYIRRFEQDGFRNREAETAEDLNTFYNLYYSNMNYIGASPRPLEFFRKAWALLYPDYFNILLTVKGERCIGAEAFFIYKPKGAVYQTFIGLDRNVGTQYRTYYYLCWGLIKWAEKNNFKQVSFGSTPADPNSINYSQKRKFGAEFNQDFVLFLPFNMRLFQLRQGMLKLGSRVAERLPKGLQRRLLDMGRG